MASLLIMKELWLIIIMQYITFMFRDIFSYNIIFIGKTKAVEIIFWEDHQGTFAYIFITDIFKVCHV